MVIGVEAVNLAVLLTNETIIDTLMNFLALVVIANFDDYLFTMIKYDRLSQMIIKGDFKFLTPNKDKGKTMSLEELTKIEVTTSRNARFEIEGNLFHREQINLEEDTNAQAAGNTEGDAAVKDENKFEGEPKYLFIYFWDRSFANKLIRIVYNILKMIHVSFWFYFIPFSSLFLSYQIPYLSGG